MSGQTCGVDFTLHDRPGEAAAKSSNRRLVARWFGEWHKPIRRFIARRNSVPPRDLDDVAQEVFLRLMHYDRADLVEQPQAYLFRMAANVAAEWMARSRSVSAREMAWLVANEGEGVANHEMVRLEAEEEIAQALLTLCPRQREVLKLQFFEGLSHAQTAKRLGVTERMVKRALAKSYQRLRRKLVPP